MEETLRSFTVNVTTRLRDPSIPVGMTKKKRGNNQKLKIMRLFTKIYLASIVCVILLQLASVCFFVAVPMAQAATAADGSKSDIRNPELVVPFNNFKDLGAVTEQPCYDDETAAKKGIAKADVPTCLVIPWLVTYINNAYRYSVVIGSIIAVVMMMIGGLMYMMAGLNQSLVGRAREYMVGAATGLALLLGSYMLLNVINPNLVHLKPIKVEIVKKAVLPPEFCEDLMNDPQFKSIINVAYPTTGETCGQKFPVTVKPGAKVNASSVKDCIGKRCREKMACDKEDNAYKCIGAFVYGHITIAQDIAGAVMGAVGVAAKQAYLDYIKLYEYSVVNPHAPEIGKAKLNQTSTEYKIERDDTRFNEQAYFLQIEVNDKEWMSSTNDDTYYVDRLGNPIGIVKNLEKCCTFKCAPNEATFTVEQGCQFFRPFQLNASAIRVDIDTNKFYCGNKPLADSKNEAGQGSFDRDSCLGFVSEKLPPLSECNKEEQCKGGSCKASTWFNKGDNVVKESACSCTENADCSDGQKCIKVKDGCGWNYCIDVNAKVPSVPQGSSGSAGQPWSGLCSQDADCEAKCESGWGANGCDACKGGLKGVGEACVGNDECATNDCEEEEIDGVDVKKCECNNDAQCPSGLQCVEMEGDGCGHNYCANGPGPVDEGGRCYNDDDCETGNCESMVGECNVCGEFED